MINLSIFLPPSTRPPSPDIGAKVRYGNRRGTVTDVIPFEPCYCVQFERGGVGWFTEGQLVFVEGRAA